MNKVRFLLLSGLLTLSSAALAQRSVLTQVTIDTLGFDQGFPGRVWVRTSISPAQQQRISCHTNNDWNFVLSITDSDPNLAKLKEATLSSLIAAQHSKQKLTLLGSGSCTNVDIAEDLQIVYTYSNQ